MHHISYIFCHVVDKTSCTESPPVKGSLACALPLLLDMLCSCHAAWSTNDHAAGSRSCMLQVSRNWANWTVTSPFQVNLWRSRMIWEKNNKCRLKISWLPLCNKSLPTWLRLTAQHVFPGCGTVTFIQISISVSECSEYILLSTRAVLAIQYFVSAHSSEIWLYCLYHFTIKRFSGKLAIFYDNRSSRDKNWYSSLVRLNIHILNILLCNFLFEID